MILVRSKEPVVIPPRPASPVSPGTFAVRCHVCARAGRLPLRLRAAIRTGDIICPSCRGHDRLVPTRPGPVGSNPVVRAVRCFTCGRRGRLTQRGRRQIRPQELLCPSCRSVSAPAPIPGVRPAGDGRFAVSCFACGRAGRLPLSARSTLRPEETLCPNCRTQSPRPQLPSTRWPSWSLDGIAVV
ncbi:MAG: hypothetical protein ACRECR_04255 [Thermoplasmata archaeon]